MSVMLRPSDVAALWQCSAGHVRKLCRTGQLRAMRLGSDWRISPEAVADFEAANTNEGRAQPCDVTPKVAMRQTASHPADYIPVFAGSVPWRSSIVEGR